MKKRNGRLFLFVTFVFAFSLIGEKNSLARQHKHTFGDYTVKTAFTSQPELRISKGKIEILSVCGGDGYYSEFATLDINQDSIPDFIYSYELEDYFSLGVFVSSSKQGQYKDVMIKDYSHAGIYCEVSKTEDLKNFILVDENKDGKLDLAINVYDKSNHHLIPNCSDIIFYDDLQKKINARLENTKIMVSDCATSKVPTTANGHKK